MKNIELIQRVQSLYSKGVQSDDTRLSNRHIFSKLKTAKSLLIIRQLNKKQKLSPFNYETLSCIELIKVPEHDCPCLPTSGCQILRSKYKLPEPLYSIYGSTITAVTSVDRSIKFNETSIASLSLKNGNKYPTKTSEYFFLNNYLYFNTPLKLKVVSMTAIFKDAEEVYKFPNYCDNECKDCQDCKDFLEEEFKIDNELIEPLIELAIQELIQIFNQNVEDINNNSRDNIKDVSK